LSPASPPAPLRGVLIGVGHVARHGHLPGWSGVDGVELVGAADARTEGRAPFLEAWPDALWSASAEELLARDDLDFADVCAPPSLHVPLARAALARGLHVLCEKPLALEPSGVDALGMLARERGRALVTVHNWKHAPAVAEVTRLVREGAVGRVRRCRWETRRTQPAVAAGAQGNWRTDPAQSGGGVLVDHGWHAAYVLREWLGGRPQALSATLETRRHREFPLEDTAEVRLEWDGARAEIFLTWAAEARGNAARIEGDRGTILLDGGRVTLCAEGASPRIREMPSLAEGSHHPDWFGGVAREFLREVREPAARGENLEAAALCARILAVSQESSRRGGEMLPVPAP
jgi:predicted dehydrogenase